VPVAIASALLIDREAAADAKAASIGFEHRWQIAVRDGVADPAVGFAARALMESALAALGRLGVDARTRDECVDFYDRYTARNRSPADDAQDARVEAA